MGNTLLMEFGHNRMERELDPILQKHETYQAAYQIADEKLDQVLKLCEEQSDLQIAVDELVSAYNHVGFLYADLAYQLGFQDAIKVVIELHEMGKEK